MIVSGGGTRTGGVFVVACVMPFNHRPRIPFNTGHWGRGGLLRLYRERGIRPMTLVVRACLRANILSREGRNLSPIGNMQREWQA